MAAEDVILTTAR